MKRTLQKSSNIVSHAMSAIPSLTGRARMGLPLMAIMMLIGAWAQMQDLTVIIDTGASVTLKDADGDGYYNIGTADELYAFATTDGPHRHHVLPLQRPL